jgi:cation-dependent mannose-6-phosphate receptor
MKTKSWQANGYDFNANFTLNICAHVIEDIKDDVDGIDQKQWQNISAFYTKGGKTYSIG